MLRSWFESIVTSLASSREISPSKRLISATCVAHCINMPNVTVLYMTHVPEKFLLPLARMLALQPGDGIKNEYGLLCSCIPLEERYEVC